MHIVASCHGPAPHLFNSTVLLLLLLLLLVPQGCSATLHWQCNTVHSASASGDMSPWIVNKASMVLDLLPRPLPRPPIVLPVCMSSPLQ